MLEIEIDGDKFCAGWHANQRFGTLPPPCMNNLRIGACVLKSVGRERRLGIFAAGEDTDASLRQLQRRCPSATCGHPDHRNGEMTVFARAIAFTMSASDAPLRFRISTSFLKRAGLG